MYKVYNFFEKHSCDIISKRIFNHIIDDLESCINNSEHPISKYQDHLKALIIINQLIDDIKNSDENEISQTLKDKFIDYIKKYFIGLIQLDDDDHLSNRIIDYICETIPLFEKNCKKIIDEIIKSNIFIMDKEFLHLLNNIF